MQWIWLAMMGLSLLYGGAAGKGSVLFEAALQGCLRAIRLTMELGAGYMFFSGMMEVARAAGAADVIQKWMMPLLRKLFPQTPEASQKVALNLSMNFLGLGNAATPAGISAMSIMDRSISRGSIHDMRMFLILNATSIQLLPTTVLALRAASGSADVQAVLLPTLLCTAASAVVGVAGGWICRKWEEGRFER